MIGLFGVFLLVGAVASSSSDWSLVESVLKHQDYLDSCADLLGAHLKTTKNCEALIADVGELKVFLTTELADGESLISQGEALLTKFNSCSTKSVFKQVACYESVIAKGKSLVATATTEEQDFVTKGTALLSKTEADATSCLSSGLTSTRFESIMSLCKLRM